MLLQSGASLQPNRHMIKISLHNIFGDAVSKENVSLIIGFTPRHLPLYLHLQARYHQYLSPALTLCCLPAQLHELFYA